MKYKLINFVSKIETLCDKITIDGFDYYINDDKPKLNDYYYNIVRGVVFKLIIPNIMNNDNWKKVIATNNPNINISKVISNSMLIEKLANTLTSNLTFPGERKEGIILGYNKSQETHPFSEEDVIEFGYFCVKHYKEKVIPKKPFKELLQLWKEQRTKIIYYNE